MSRARRAFALGAAVLATAAGAEPGGLQRRAGPASSPVIVFMAYDSAGPSDLVIADTDGAEVRLLLAATDAPLAPSAHRWPQWCDDDRHVVFASLMPVRPTGHPELNATGPGLYMIDADGGLLCKVAPLRDIQDPNPACAPAARPGWTRPKIVFADRLEDPACTLGSCAQWDLFLVDAACDAPTPVNLTRTPAQDERFPTWSPDARQIAASVQPLDRGRRGDLVVFTVEDETLREVTDLGRPDECLSLLFPDWSRRGDRIVACCAGEMSGDLWIYSLDSQSWAPLSGAGEHGLRPTWSPDDEQIVFDHEDLPALSIVTAAPGSRGQMLLAPPAGSATRYMAPDWSRRRREASR